MNFRLESEEIWKTLELTERTISEKYDEAMCNPSGMLIPKSVEIRAENFVLDLTKHKHDLNELFDYYLGVCCSFH